MGNNHSTGSLHIGKNRIAINKACFMQNTGNIQNFAFVHAKRKRYRSAVMHAIIEAKYHVLSINKYKSRLNYWIVIIFCLEC